MINKIERDENESENEGTITGIEWAKSVFNEIIK